MKCKNCGAELSDDAKFCSSCGHKLTTDVEPPQQNRVQKPDGSLNSTERSATSSTNVAYEATSPTSSASRPDHDSTNESAYQYGYSGESHSTQPSKTNHIKEYFLSSWNKMDIFCRILAIMSVIAVFVFLFSLIHRSVFCVILSIFEIIGLVVSLLLHRGIIKFDTKRENIKYLVLVVVFLLMILNIWGFSRKNRHLVDDPSSGFSSASTNLVDSESFAPHDASDCIGKNYMTLADSFRDAGFINIRFEKVEDITISEASKLDTVQSVSINGISLFDTSHPFKASDEVIVYYHAYQKCSVNLHVSFVGNLFFSKYDVSLQIDGSDKGTLSHGEDQDFKFTTDPGNHTFKFVNSESSSVYGEIELNITGNTSLELEIYCNSDNIDVSTTYIEDSGLIGENQLMITGELLTAISANHDETAAAFKQAGFTNIKEEVYYDAPSNSDSIGQTETVTIGGQTEYHRGDVVSKDIPIVITYHENESLDPVKLQGVEDKKELESVFPRTMARRALIVAMTNCQASDVFTSDGNSYDTNKFHSYADTSGFFMDLEADGIWSAVDTYTWHVENIVLQIPSTGTYLKAAANITLDGTNYIVSNADCLIGSKKNLEENNNSYLTKEHFEPSDFNSFMTVPYALIADDRYSVPAPEVSGTQTDRQQWIDSQFHWWDGRHIALSKLIKEQLNDRDSFEHVNAEYIDVSNEDTKNTVNGLLKDADIHESVEIGDLLVMEEFSAKNVFNATVRNTGIGIVKNDDTVILIGII